MSTRETGRKYEKLAADILEERGWHTFRPPRIRFQGGDFLGWLDILAVKDKGRWGSWWEDWFGDLCLIQVKTRQNFSWEEMEAKAKVFPETVRLILLLWSKTDKGFKVFVWLANNRKFREIERRLKRKDENC